MSQKQIRDKKANLQIENKSGASALILACGNEDCDPQVVRYLLECDVDVNRQISSKSTKWKIIKIASRLARSYSDNHSLRALIKEFINVDISKQFQNSDFGGELKPEQLKYCANDVIYLHKIHEELTKILKRENRIELYMNCLKFLKTRVELDLASFGDDIWSH